MKVSDVRQYFIDELSQENFTLDRTGQKTIEMFAASFIADEPAIFGTPNQEYIDAEIEWYMDQSTNINALAKIYGKSPAAWEYSANDYGEINSNYGHLIFGEVFHNQFRLACDELRNNPDSRRACMVYTRPSIWKEYNEDGKNDFICTNAVTYYIRDGRVNCVVQMRSNDCLWGYRNDYAWQKCVLDMVAKDVWVDPGDIYWQVQNLHVYERHFGMVK